MNGTLGIPRGAIVGLLVFSFFSNLLQLTVPIYMLQVFDRVLSSRSVETLTLLSLVALGALLTAAFLEIVRTRLLLRIANRITGQWGKRLLAEGDVGGGVSRVQDLMELKTFIGNGGLLPLLDAPFIPLYIGVLFLFNPLFGWVGIGGGLVIAAIVFLSEVRMRDAINDAHQAAGNSMVIADTISKNADSVQALGMLERMAHRWELASFAGLRKHYVVTSRLAVDNAMAKFVRMAVQVSVLGGAAYLVTLGQLTPGLMIAGVILIARAMAPLEAAIGGWRSIVSAFQAYGRLSLTIESMALPRRRQTERLRGKMTLDRVTLVKDRRTLLNNLNLTVEPGEIIAITGPSGAGKTTLVRTSLGLIRPTLGKVLIDDVEMGNWNPMELGRAMGYLAQDGALFDGTIAENIARMEFEPDLTDVHLAGKRAFVHDMILGLPDGYETRIYGRDPQLAPGQRQRILLARALYGEPRLVVLDEPETYLDPDGEQALLQALTALKRASITALVVTYRPEILLGVDRVLVMKDGLTQAIGPVDKVLPRLRQSAALPPRDSQETPKALPEQQRQRAESDDDRPESDSGVPQDQRPSPRNKSESRANNRERNQPRGNNPQRRRRQNEDSPEVSRPRDGNRNNQPRPAAEREPRPRPQSPSQVLPDAGIVERNRTAAEQGRLTLELLLDRENGAFGEWILRSHGRVGERYLRRLQTRLKPLLAHTLQSIDADRINAWRRERTSGGDDESMIQRAVQASRFDEDQKALRDCLVRTLQWQVLSEHPLIAGTPSSSAKEAASEAAGGSP